MSNRNTLRALGLSALLVLSGCGNDTKQSVSSIPFSQRTYCRETTQPLSYDPYRQDIIKEEIIAYDGQKILAVQQRLRFNNSFSIIVPGYVKQEEPINEHGIQRIVVEIIPKEKHSRIERLLREGNFEGPIHFWN